MNRRNGIFFLLFLLAALSFAEDTVHVVEKGETVYSISRSFRISPEELMRYNNITDASKLQIGRRLRIPGDSAGASSAPLSASGTTSAASSAVNSYTEYRVARNDTLYSIARTNGVTLEVLRNANGFSADHVLKAGELIKIPRTAQATGTSQTAVRPAAPVEARTTTSKIVDTRLRWPVQPKESAYMTGKLYGVMLTGERHETVKSLTRGTVVSAGPYRGFGRVAIVQVTGGYLYVYGGCESLSVKEGDRVGPGTELGKLGIDSVSEKPQLFFLVYKSNAPIDPAKAPRT
jgi:murein DD-endopeptidase MepM/ murein hydrolase activator NlpD